MDTQELLDREEIRALLTRYTRAIDRGEWDLLDAVFTPDAQVDYTATGGIAASYVEVKAWLAEVLPLFPRRMHLLGQVDVTVEGDRARVTAYFTNPMVLAGADGSEALLEYGGFYHHELVRTEHGWRSSQLVEELVWHRGHDSATGTAPA